MTSHASPRGGRPRVSALVVSGLAEIALGAVTGFPYAAAVYTNPHY